jgi:DNA-binding NarL/FixJ family response regulator
MGAKRTILIIDDHPFFREGVKALLARRPEFEVIGEAANGAEGLRKATELKPAVVLMDISLPDRSGIEVTYDIRSSLPETRVAILSMHLDIDYIARAFQAGATGYVVKESAPERLIECLEALTKGRYFVDSSLSHKVVERLLHPGDQKAKMLDAAYSTLTSREQEIMRLLAEGLSAKEIADNLCISQKTVENHRSSIMRKLDLHTTMDLVRYAAKFGMIDLDCWRNRKES